jgi:hypothetical protein
MKLTTFLYFIVEFNLIDYSVNVLIYPLTCRDGLLARSLKPKVSLCLDFNDTNLYIKEDINLNISKYISH